jgi:hypothetical protein
VFDGHINKINHQNTTVWGTKLEISQVFMKSFALKGIEHLKNSDEETNQMEKRGEKWEVMVIILKWIIRMGKCVPG